MTAPAPRSAPPRPRREPGWLSRQRLPMAHAATEPRLHPVLHPLALLHPFESRRYAGAHPLALLRLAALRDLLVAHWTAPPGLVHPWHLVPRVNLWHRALSQPHYEFRVRQRRGPQEVAETGRGIGAQRRAGAPLASVPDMASLPHWLESPDQAETALFEAEAETAQSSLPVLTPFEPLSVAPEWLSSFEDTGAGRAALPGAAPLPASRLVARREAGTGAPSTPVRRTGRESAFSLELDIPRRTESSVTRDSETVEPTGESVATAGVAPLGKGASANAEPDYAAAHAGMPDIEPGTEAVSWPFAFLTPAMVSLATRAEPSQESGLVPHSQTAAPMTVRRYRPAEQAVSEATRTPLVPPELRRAMASVTVPHVAQETSRQVSIADERIMQVLPLRTMLSQVPASELGLGQTPSDQVGTVRRSIQRVPSEELGSAQKQVGSADVTSFGTDRAAPEVTPAPAAPPIPEPLGLVPESVRAEASLERLSGGWSLLESVLRRAAAPATVHEPAAMQVLRRLPMERRAETLARVASLPALGSGEALPEPVRRPLEALHGRDLGGVRTFASEAAEALGAEAFTTGERIVFAPGRMDLRSARGLALVAHEVAHVGQPLAFREQGSPTASDAGEEAARRQEEQVLRIIEQGWPQAPRMDVLDAGRALANLMERGGAMAGGAQGPAGGDGSATETAGAAGGAEAAQAGGAEGLPTARLSAAPTGAPGSAGGAQPAAADLGRLAQEVYSLLKARLRDERTRHFVD